MILKETMLRRQDVFHGRILDIHVDQVELPNGHISTREVADHADGVAVLALDDAHQVLMVRQYRYVFQRELLELPAGKLDPDEDPLTGALRELKEETGAVPKEIVSLGRVLPSPGCFGEVLHLFFAKGFRLEAQQLDDDEFLNVEQIPFDDLVLRCTNGEIEDGKTVTAVLRAKLLLNL